MSWKLVKLVWHSIWMTPNKTGLNLVCRMCRRTQERRGSNHDRIECYNGLRLTGSLCVTTMYLPIITFSADPSLVFFNQGSSERGSCCAAFLGRELLHQRPQHGIRSVTATVRRSKKVRWEPGEHNVPPFRASFTMYSDLTWYNIRGNWLPSTPASDVKQNRSLAGQQKVFILLGCCCSLLFVDVITNGWPLTFSISSLRLVLQRYRIWWDYFRLD